MPGSASNSKQLQESPTLCFRGILFHSDIKCDSHRPPNGTFHPSTTALVQATTLVLDYYNVILVCNNTLKILSNSLFCNHHSQGQASKGSCLFKLFLQYSLVIKRIFVHKCILFCCPLSLVTRHR